MIISQAAEVTSKQGKLSLASLAPRHAARRRGQDMTVLNAGELERLVGGMWQLDCQRITLRQRSPNAPNISAPGWIKHNDDGDLRFKLIGAGSIEAVEALCSKPSGRILEPEDLCDLEALDEFHRTWIAERVYVDTVRSSLEGWIPRLAIERRSTSQNQNIRLILPEEVEIPCNVLTESTTRVGGRIEAQEGKWNVAECESMEHRFRFTADASPLQLEIWPEEGSLLPNIEILATDALTFCLARPLKWVASEKVESGTYKLEIRPRRLEPEKGRRMAPRHLRREKPNDAFWSIFERYVAYTSKYSGEGRHPLSARVLDVLDAAIASADAHALTLCVAIEGLLSDTFKNGARLAPGFLESFGRAKAALQREDLDPQFRSRVFGLLGMLKKPSAKDLLRELAKK
jgi:hypothetical protein